ncbi:MAG: branched-chain amino acid transporter, periplasmic amino acid-binding protein [Candidatus Eremiobacteraeota bacterium]|nr:branched-chain amino acid transporter, periplasmic amino acid-binding protein [Candidatus Eremiobacteraeota bacterium]
MERKRFLATVGGGAAAAALGGLPARAADEVVFAGVYSATGAYAAFGRDTDRGFQLAVNEFKKSVDGHPIKYITRDDQTKPDVGQQQVTDAYEHDGARFFAGIASSSVALAIGQVARDKRALFFTSVGADEITGKDCNPYTFRWSVPAYGAVRATLYPFIAKYPNLKKWYTITPSYVFGESLLTNVKEVAQEKGISLIGNDYHPLGATEFSNYVAKAAEAKPDVLVLLNFGGDAIKALKTANSYGLKKTTKILYVWSGGLLDFAGIGADDLDGVHVGCQYWHDSTPATRKASEAYKAAYGEPLGYVGASAYIEARLTFQGIAKARSTDPARVAKALEGLKYAGPTGAEEIRAFDHQVVKPYYLLVGKPKGAMKDQWDYVDTVAFSSHPVPRERSLCRL